MTRPRVSVTLEADAVARAREIAGPNGLSSYLDAAVHEKLARDRQRRIFLAYVDESAASVPPPPGGNEQATRPAAWLRTVASD